MPGGAYFYVCALQNQLTVTFAHAAPPLGTPTIADRENLQARTGVKKRRGGGGVRQAKVSIDVGHGNERGKRQQATDRKGGKGMKKHDQRDRKVRIRE